MLIEFKFKNFRSFRDEATLSLEATGLGTFKNCLISYGSEKLLPGVAIYGKNGGGKSNVIRAFWLAVQFIRNAQRTQHENASIPVSPFSLNDYSKNQPTTFEFTYVLDNVKYIYGFSATREKIISEYLYHSPKGQKAIVFERTEQKFKFTEDKAKRNLISEAVASNQLFFSTACTMNDTDCVIYYPDGSKYNGEIADGVKNGKGQLTYANGDIAKGTFASGALSGEAEYYFNDKKIWAKVIYEKGKIIKYILD